jgi:hypothetical protein
MSADGRTVAFQSFASDLVDGDYNEHRDIFVVKLGAGDSDNDGIDNNWEVAYFGDLSRDGAGTGMVMGKVISRNSRWD